MSKAVLVRMLADDEYKPSGQSIRRCPGTWIGLLPIEVARNFVERGTAEAVAITVIKLPAEKPANDGK